MRQLIKKLICVSVFPVLLLAISCQPQPSSANPTQKSEKSVKQTVSSDSNETKIPNHKPVISEKARPVDIPNPDTTGPDSSAEPIIDKQAKPIRAAAAEPDHGNTITDEPNDLEKTKKTLSKGDAFNEKFEELFTAYVNDEGRVDYNKLQFKQLLIKAMLAEVAMLEPKEYDAWSRDEKIAFWVNTYNLKILDIITDNYPIDSVRVRRLWWPPDSIRHIPPISQVGTPKWDRYKFIVMDEQFTLLEIENRFFREKLKDPRIFLAISFASIGGPPLRNEPYYGKSLEQQLEDQAKRYLNSPEGLEIKTKKEQVRLSVLFEPSLPWFGNEFLEDYATDKKFKNQKPEIRAVLNFAIKYLPPHKKNILETGNYEVQFKAYDWRLNDQ